MQVLVLNVLDGCKYSKWYYSVIKTLTLHVFSFVTKSAETLWHVMILVKLFMYVCGLNPLEDHKLKKCHFNKRSPFSVIKPSCDQTLLWVIHSEISPIKAVLCRAVKRCCSPWICGVKPSNTTINASEIYKEGSLVWNVLHFTYIV